MYILDAYKQMHWLTYQKSALGVIPPPPLLYNLKIISIKLKITNHKP